MKACFKCGETKPLDDFYRHSKMADGHLNKCKECTKRDMHESRHVKHRERALSYGREYAKRPYVIERKKAYSKAYIKQHPDRRSAQIAIGNAVRDGKIVPLPCFVCGEKAEAHHPDYSAPLDVVWLCSSHHKQAHHESF